MCLLVSIPLPVLKLLNAALSTLLNAALSTLLNAALWLPPFKSFVEQGRVKTQKPNHVLLRTQYLQPGFVKLFRPVLS